MRFIVKDTNYFDLPGNAHMLHLATIGYGLREFILMFEKFTNKCYIEEVVLVTVDFKKDVFANFKFIDDENLANDLASFVEEKQLRDMKKIHERLIDENKIKLIP